MKAPRSVLAAILLALACPAAVGISRLQAGEPPASAPSPTLRFLRVYAPADRLKEWPLGNVRYLPIKPDEF